MTAHLTNVGAVSDDVADDPKLSANATFKERYAAQQLRDFTNLRAATRKLEAEATASQMRALESPDDVPDGYRVAMEDRKPVQCLTPDCWPGYSRENPPDIYAVAAALRTLNEEATPRVAAPARSERKMLRDPHP